MEDKLSTVATAMEHWIAMVCHLQIQRLDMTPHSQSLMEETFVYVTHLWYSLPHHCLKVTDYTLYAYVGIPGSHIVSYVTYNPHKFPGVCRVDRVTVTRWLWRTDSVTGSQVATPLFETFNILRSVHYRLQITDLYKNANQNVHSSNLE